MQDPRADGGQLEHLVITDVCELARGFHDARVGSEDAVDVREDLARVCLEGRGERDRGCIGPSAPEGRDLEVLSHPLETRHHRHLAFAQRFEDAIGPDVVDARARVMGAGSHAGLQPGQ